MGAGLCPVSYPVPRFGRSDRAYLRTRIAGWVGEGAARLSCQRKRNVDARRVGQDTQRAGGQDTLADWRRRRSLTEHQDPPDVRIPATSSPTDRWAIIAAEIFTSASASMQ